MAHRSPSASVSKISSGMTKMTECTARGAGNSQVTNSPSMFLQASFTLDTKHHGVMLPRCPLGIFPSCLTPKTLSSTSTKTHPKESLLTVSQMMESASPQSDSQPLLTSIQTSDGSYQPSKGCFEE
jgi:hypothetical protein